MPHTSRPKRTSIPTQKRLQVTDDDGWTHVTSSSNVRRVMRARVPNANQENDTPIQEPILRPAEAPSRLTLSELQTQYATHRARWTESSTWETLTRHLEQIRRKRADKILGSIDAIICIGLGSASGFLRDGWVDRRSVSMYQLAALECIKEQLSQSGDTVPLSFPIYAQDPVFNTLDIALLESLGITVVEHPVAFKRITQNSLLFCPGAEKKHLELVLSSNPWIVFGGPLETADSEVIRRYLSGVESRVLVPFEVNEHAFWNMRLYFQCEEEL